MKLEGIFLEVINLSLVGSLITLILLMIRIIFRRNLSQSIKYLLWGILFLRLCLPFSVTSNLSILNFLPEKAVSVTQNQSNGVSRVALLPFQQVVNSRELEIDTLSQQQAHPIVTPTTAKSPHVGVLTLTQMMSYFWIIGFVMFWCLIMSVYGKTCYGLNRSKKRSSVTFINTLKKEMGVKRRVVIYSSPELSTPLVSGGIQSVIFLPTGFEDNNEDVRRYILSHELVHIKRHDNLIKLLSLCLLSFHWFNPLIWLAYFKMIQDMESSCDEQVLKKSQEDVRGQYANCLLELAIQQQKVSRMTTFVGFGESNLKKRVKVVMQYRTKTKLSVGISLLLVLVVGCSLVTNPKEKEEIGKEVISENSTEFIESSTSSEMTDRLLYESGRLLTHINEPIEVNQSSIYLADYELKQDTLLLYYVEGTMSEKEVDPKLSPQVFYGETLLSPLTADDGNQVSLTNNPEVPMCKDEDKISGMTTRYCYLAFPYVGDGEYLLSHLTDNGYAHSYLQLGEMLATSEEDERKFIGEQISWQYETQLVNLIQYAGEPDELTKQLTDYIFLTSGASKPKTEFNTIAEADPLYLLENAISMTQRIEYSNLTDDVAKTYIQKYGLSGTRLREHVETTAKVIYGEGINLPYETDLSLHTWDEKYQVYFTRETESGSVIPSVLEIKDEGDQYRMIVAMPVSAMGGYFADADEEFYETIEEAVVHCLKREMVVKYQVDGQLTLVSHHFLAE